MAQHELMIISWDDETKTWDMSARADGSQEWVNHDGDEAELDELLALGRDIMTGG